MFIKAQWFSLSLRVFTFDLMPDVFTSSYFFYKTHVFPSHLTLAELLSKSMQLAIKKYV